MGGGGYSSPSGTGGRNGTGGGSAGSGVGSGGTASWPDASLGDGSAHGSAAVAGGGSTGRGGSSNSSGGAGGAVVDAGTGGATAGADGSLGRGGSTRVADGGGAAGGSDNPGGAGVDGGGAATSDATIVPDPGWACGMPDGIPSPTQGQLAFTVTFELGATHDVGNTPFGHRRLLDVKGGTITGDKIKGSVLAGGLEYELTLSNGVVEFQGINILKTGDGALIYVRSCGVSPDGSSTPRVVPDYEAATSGSYNWLNTGTFVATRALDSAAGTLTFAVYDVAEVATGAPRIVISKPAGVPKQPWDCNTTTGGKGASVFTENVTLGSSISIANAKRGSRNIIPITGGTTTGKVAGAILSGGADYQLSGSLDAWYTLAPSNGELILVRNCGPMGKLIPWFEARSDGNYAFLNSSAYLSSDPGTGSGGVSITFYERQ